MPCMTQPINSIQNEWALVTISVPVMHPTSESRSGILRLPPLSAKCPITGPETTETNPWRARVVEVRR